MLLQERLNRRTLLKVAGGALLASVVDLRRPGGATAMTRMRWVEQGVFPRTGLYRSAVFTAEQPYNSIEVSWLASVPDGAELRFAVRSSVDGSSWSDWIPLHRDTHVRSLPADRAFASPVLTSPSNLVQYQVELVPNALGATPLLSEVEIGCVDTSPPARFMAEGDNLIDGWIISRAGWGADESLRFKDGKEIWPPEYKPIEKVIVHHTVTQNNEADPAATVRAIYYYHAVTQGWGDIGYNFLIDWHGNVYEGRAGGPNVIGGHALQYNRGSLGIAILGDFTSVTAPKPALDALVRLIKERAPNVDPAGWGFFIDTDNVANICGHRDVLSTDCPGNELYVRLPEIRGWVKGTGPIYGPGDGQARAELVSVKIAPATIRAGEAVRVDAVVKNTGPVTIYTQEPAPGTTYFEGQDFQSAGFPKLLARYRVCVDVQGNTGLPNPWRWGLPGPLEPGQQATVTGYIRLTRTGRRTLTASLIQEFMKYEQQGVFPQEIVVTSPPTAPAPRSNEPGMTYFEVTQHNVPAVFHNYWVNNGGLTRFGYPLTEPFSEVSSTDGKTYLTQYFERARFEHHPENAGTPYEVLLGLLGRERTRGREDEAPFKPLPGITPTPDRDYFPETGHTLAYGFRDYWHANGGLPIFGFPISEEFEEVSKTDGKTYTVQYFERARFEWHPEFRGTQYEYLLGHLAREMLIDRGWLKSEV